MTWERPDWTDPSAYPDHGKSLRLWRWEFMRRDPDYERAYADAQGEWRPHQNLVTGRRYVIKRAPDPSVWGAEWMSDPAMPEPASHSVRAPHVYYGDATVRELNKQGYIVAAIDPDFPLDEQLTGLRQVLDTFGGMNSANRQWKKYPLWLRLIDAKYAGAKSIDIARVLNLEGMEATPHSVARTLRTMRQPHRLGDK